MVLQFVVELLEWQFVVLVVQLVVELQLVQQVLQVGIECQCDVTAVAILVPFFDQVAVRAFL